MTSKTLRTILIISAVASLFSVAAFVVAIKDFQGRFQRFEQPRIESAKDDCHTLKQIILVASAQSTQPNRAQVQAATQLFLRNTGLNNCNKYALRVVKRP